ncbi:MAG: hypothetical protein L0216_04645, partial [Planctomycetales bacterium]|nr:hypothetical protein [Planctomycetales bacterium]
LGILAAGLPGGAGPASGQVGGGAPPPPPQEPPPESKPPEAPPEAPPQEPPAETKPQEPPADSKPKPKPRGRTQEPEPTKPAEPTPDAQEPPKPGEEPEAKPGEKPAAKPAAKGPGKRRPRISPRLPRRDRDLEARGGLGLALLSGAVRKDLVGSLGTRTDFSDLDLDGVTLVAPLEAMFHLSPRLSVSAEFFYVAIEGSPTLEKKVTFNGATYAAGTKLETFLDATVAGLAARYFANSSEISTFDVEAGVRYFGSQIRMRADGATRRSVETTDAFIPFLGFHGQVWLYKELRLEAGGRIGVLAIGNNSDNQTNGMFEFYARFSLPIPLPGHLGERAQARVSLGYHFFSVNAERKDGGAQEDLELTAQGPMLSLLLRF